MYGEAKIGQRAALNRPLRGECHGYDVQQLQCERMIRRAGEDDDHLLIGKHQDELPAAAAGAVGGHVAAIELERAEPPLVSVIRLLAPPA
jgi:hypothetical protein